MGDWDEPLVTDAHRGAWRDRAKITSEGLPADQARRVYKIVYTYQHTAFCEGVNARKQSDHPSHT